MISGMGEGGKGGAEPIYKPRFTGALENMQTIQTMAAQNPAALRALYKTPEGQQMFEQLGIGTGGGYSGSSSQPSAQNLTPWEGTPMGGGAGNLPGSPFQYGGLQPMQGGGGGSQTVAGGGNIDDMINELAASAPVQPKTDYDKYMSMIKTGSMDVENTPNADGSPNWNLAAGGSTVPQMNEARINSLTKKTKFKGPKYGKSFNFTADGIDKSSDQAWQGAMDMNQEGAQQGLQKGMAQVASGAAAKGFSTKSGAANAANTSLGRAAMQQTSDANRGLGLQRAMSDIDVAKYNTTMEQSRQAKQAAEQLQRDTLGGQGQMWRQSSQAGENLSRDQMGGALQNQANTQLMQKIGAMGGLEQAKTGQAMQPYGQMSALYGQNIGIPVPSSGQKGDPFSAIMGAAGSAFCLPEGTPIRMSDGVKMPVEEIEIGDRVLLGGKVIAVGKRARQPGHEFWKHRFDTGEVTMSAGHPFYDKLVAMESVENESEFTYDILTEEGYYFIGGVKIGSTL